MAFEFSPAAREKVGLLIAFAGASGSGKTMSALRLARGMCGDDRKIAFLDTEARRGLHYAPMPGEAPSESKFAFMHADMRPPFRPERFVEAIRAAEASGAEVVIIDSFSHEYDGEGGIMDWADQLAESGVKSPGNWKDPKLAHKKLMNALLQTRASLIFCLRADEKIEIIREGGRTQVRPLGWVPICEKRFMFEMTASFTLIPDQPGRPQFNLPHKLQSQHRDFFPEGRFIDESMGQQLAEWARGGSSPATAARPAASSSQAAGHLSGQVIEAGRSAAMEGIAKYEAWFLALDKTTKREMVDAGHHEQNKLAAQRADKQALSQADDPDYGFPGDRQ